VRFVLYIPAAMRGLKVDWDTPRALSVEAREAMQRDLVVAMRGGRLRRPFRYDPPPAGTRTKSVKRRAPTLHAKNALVFTNAGDSLFWIELDEPAASP
jgi:hypothetical protein